MTGPRRPTATHTDPPQEPVLTWPGKSLSFATNTQPIQLCAEHLERFVSTGQSDGLLLHGDNRDSLSWLLEQGYGGKVQLVYIDPPYDSGSAWASKVRLRGERPVQIGAQEEYNDSWPPGGYLQFMAERLLLLRRLLTPNGTLWLHCDHRRQSHLHLLLTEIFGPDCFLNTIAWRSQTARGAKVHARYFPNSTHYIHIFGNSAEHSSVWNRPVREIVLTRSEAAARFMEDDGGFFRTSHPGSYSFEKLVELHSQGRVYAPHGGQVVVDAAERRVYASNGGNIGIKYYIEKRGRDRFVVIRAVDNLWDDIPGLGTVPGEDVNYPTQKSTGLLRRIIETATNPGDTVLDAFVGSGTTGAVAGALGRHWIGCDANWRAIRTSSLRVMGEELNAEAQRRRGAEEKVAQEARQEAARQGEIRVVRVGAEVEIGDSSAPVLDDAEARIVVAEAGDGLRVVIHSFRSRVVEHLCAQAGKEPPDDWHATVAAVLIDPTYDGKIFKGALTDAPTGKKALVQGDYTIPLSPSRPDPKPLHPVAVRLVDVAGNELLVVIERDAIIRP